MTLANSQTDQTERQAWMAVLARTDVASLQQLLDESALQPHYQLPRPVETGLAMVRARVSSSGEPFNLGEMTVTRCVIQLTDKTVGVAYIKGRDKQQAELAAVIDALLQNKQLPLSKIAPLEEAIINQRIKRAEEVAATKVDFFTMVRGES